MSDVARLSIAIDSASARTATQDLNTLGRTADGIASKVKSMAKGVAAALGIMSFGKAIKDITMLAARYDTLGISMYTAGRNAGYGREEMDRFEKALKETGISALESRQSLMSMATANMDLAQSSKLARVAQDLAVVGNMNSSDAFNTLIRGIQTGNTVIMRNLGLNMQFKEGNEEVAASLGKTVRQLTSQDKVQARMNQVLKEAAKYTGIYEGSMESAGKKMGSMSRYAQDFKVKMGAAFQPALGMVVDKLTDSFKAMNNALERAQANGDMARWGENVKAGIEKATGVIGGSLEIMWKYRSALIAIGVSLVALKAAYAVTELVQWVKAKWQAAQVSVHQANLNRIEAVSKEYLSAATKVNTLAMYDEAKAAHFAALEKNSDALASGKLSLALAQEQAEHHMNKIAMLDEAKADVLNGKAKAGFTRTLGAFIGPMGLATVAIGAAAYAWGAWRKSVQEAAEALDKMRQKQMETIAATNTAASAVGAEEKTLKSATAGNKEKGEAQIRHNRAVQDLIDKYPELLGKIKREGDNYLATKKELQELNMERIKAEILVAEKAVRNVNDEMMNAIDNQWSIKGLIGHAAKIYESFETFQFGEGFKAIGDAAASTFGSYTINEDNFKALENAQAHLEGLRKEATTLKRDMEDDEKVKKLADTEGDKEKYAALAKAQKEYLDGLREEIETMGKSRAEMIEYTADKKLAAKEISEAAKQAAYGFAAEVRNIENMGKQKEFIEGLEKEKQTLLLTGDALWKYKAGLEGVSDQMDYAVSLMKGNEFEKIRKGLEEQVATFGMDEDERTIYQLKQLGLVESQVDAIKQLIAKNRELKTAEGVRLDILQQQEEEAKRIRDLAKSLIHQYDPDLTMAENYADLKKLQLPTEIYNKALRDLRAEHLRLRAEAGDTWAIIGYTIQQSAQSATDSLVTWMNKLEGVGRTWKSLGETVRRVLADMLIDMQRMIMQKQVMEPLMGWAGAKLGGVYDMAGAKDGGVVGPDKSLAGSGLDAASAEAAVGVTAFSQAMKLASGTLGTLPTSVTAVEGQFGALTLTSKLTDTAFTGLTTAAYNAAAALASIEVGEAGQGVGGWFAGMAGQHASGGSVLAGSRYLVGEQGPELFVPGFSGYIVPNNALRQGGGGENVAVTIVQNIHSSGSGDTRTTGDRAGLYAGMAKQIKGVVLETLAEEKRLGNSLNPVFGGR